MSALSPASDRRRRWCGRLGLLVAATLIDLVAGEGLVRVGLGEQPKFPRRVVEGPVGLRINEPGAVYHHRSADVSVEFRINSRGLRSDREYPDEKPKGTQRIVSLGDSFTVGYEVEVEQCFSSILERELRARGRSVEVLNAGVSGFGTAEQLLYLERELLRYSPDLVLITFYTNDLVDNVRSDLFVLEDGVLVPHRERYVPLGRVGNFLNTNRFFNFLSERSDLFALLKERATRALKGKLVQQNLEDLEARESEEGAGPAAPSPEVDYRRRLTGALYERLYRKTQSLGIPLVVQSIPSFRPKNGTLEDLFPSEYFDVARPGLTFFPAKSVLDPYREDHLLYYRRSTGHWTPFSHEVCAEALVPLVENALDAEREGEGG